MATFTEGSGLVAGPATTAPFLKGSKLALWTGQTINFRGAKYFAARKLIVCPVHNASFNPFKKGAVVAGPAITALPSVKVAVKGGWIVVL